MEDVILIPAYQPDGVLVELVDALTAQNLGVLVVNDGSSPDCDWVFAAISEKACVVNQPQNGGKGAALKRGMEEVQTLFPDCRYLITADADGQHKISDILRVRDELRTGAQFVLTVRDLRNRHNVPFRSRFGNNLSRFIYTMLTGHYFVDNQSGLRGFPVEAVSWLTKVDGEKYDYEMNMLYYADKQRIPITTLPIEAVYIDGNKSSHFDPVNDTLRIYRRLFVSAWVSFATAFACEISVWILFLTPLGRQPWFSLPGVGVAAAFCNLLLNKFAAFRRVRYRDGARAMFFTILRFAFYAVLCEPLHLLHVPLPVSFHLAALATVPAEYYLCKGIHLWHYPDVNKEL